MNEPTRYRVRILPQAEAQLLQHHGWLAERAHFPSDAWWADMIQALQTLELFPNAHAMAEESDDLGGGLRKFTHGRHVALFRVDEAAKEVRILYLRPAAMRAF